MSIKKHRAANMDLSKKKYCQTNSISFSDTAIRLVDREEVANVIFFMLVRLLTRHSYVQTRKHGLAENNVPGCELIGNLKDS